MSNDKKLELAFQETVEIIEVVKGRAVNEVVDSGSDLVQIIQILERLLKDGFQIVDIIGFVELQPIATEFWRDLGVTATQILTALPGETLQAAIDINKESKRRGAIGKISGFVLGVFYTLASGYVGADMALQIFNAQKSNVEALVNGTLVIPDEVPLLLQQ